MPMWNQDLDGGFLSGQNSFLESRDHTLGLIFSTFVPGTSQFRKVCSVEAEGMGGCGFCGRFPLSNLAGVISLWKTPVCGSA